MPSYGTCYFAYLQPSAIERSQAVDLLFPSNQAISNNTGSRVLHAQTKAHYQKEMRDELLGYKGRLLIAIM
jgi:hypothetical protein